MKKLFFFICILLGITGCNLFPQEEDDLYTISVEIRDGLGSVTPSDVTNPVGTSASFVVTPNSGYITKSATLVRDDGISAVVSIKDNVILLADMKKGNYSLVISCEKKIPQYYTISATCGEGGTVSPADTSIIEGGSVTVTNHLEYGWEVDTIIKVNGKVVPNTTDTSYTFYNVYENYSINWVNKKGPKWYLTNAVWKLIKIEMDNILFTPYNEILVFYRNGKYTFFYNDKYAGEREWKENSFNYGGNDCRIEIINETILVSSYINSYNQIVRKYYQNIEKLPF